ncbi:MAG: alkaline phosphatase family protein [Chloroflexota bacterium]|nr:alkaline phosphatase family protein [Chloroflexota bacterium]
MSSNTDRRRVLVIGADGADPKVLRGFLKAGKLPHLARLISAGSSGSLQTTFPPVSPVAWGSFLTGVGPPGHGIRDFVTKVPGAYRPTIGLFTVSADATGLPVYTGRRRAPTLAQILGDNGRRSFLLKVPGTFPPDPTLGGTLAGLGMPDLRGSFGTSALYTTDPDRKREANSGENLSLHILSPDGEVTWHSIVEGPGSATVPLHCRISGGRLSITLGNAPHPVAALKAGEWSEWLRVTFAVSGRGDIPGLFRLRAMSLNAGHVELYRTAVQCAPDAPLFPLSEPAGFAADLASRIGPYATLGLSADETGMRQGLITPDVFLEDAYHGWEEQAAIVETVVREQDWHLCVAHFFAIDNVQHLFWHYQDQRHPAFTPEGAVQYGGEVERAYRWVDAQVGRLLEWVDENTVVMVVSDHGSTPIHRHVYLNAWLQQQGYLRSAEVPSPPDGPRKISPVDWDHTCACMFGTGNVWLNVRGREPRGTIDPGPEYEVLRRRIGDDLLAWRDPEIGRPVIKAVLRGEEVYGDSAREQGPDLIPVLHLGYGLGRGESLGRVVSGAPLVELNRSQWSGGHEGPYLPDDVPGVLVVAGPGTRQGVELDGARIIDVAPTILHLLGEAVPAGMEGRVLVQLLNCDG